MNNQVRIQGVINELKESIPNFAENVNSYSTTNNDCKTFVKSLDKYFDIENNYSIEQLHDGYDIANDFLGVLAINDESYNKKSHYGTFCGVSASRANKELPDYFNKGDDVARTILNNLKGKISSEEGNCDDYCSAFINVVSKTLDLKKVYSISEILNGHGIVNDIGYYLAQEDYKDYSNLYQGICDSDIKEKTSNNNYQLLVAQYNLKNDFNYENIVNYNHQKAIAEEFKFNSKIYALIKDVSANKEDSNSKIDALIKDVAANKEDYNSKIYALIKDVAANKENSNSKVDALIKDVAANKENSNSKVDALIKDVAANKENSNSKVDALIKDVAANKEDSNSKIDALTNKVADIEGFHHSMQKSYEELSAQVNGHDESLQGLISANKETNTEEVSAQEVDVQVSSHDTSDM